MAEARNRFDWQTMFDLCVDPEKAREMRAKSEDKDRDVCTMCGDFCALKTHARAFGTDDEML
jgi:phosphomethylpyrimidine synthase